MHATEPARATLTLALEQAAAATDTPMREVAAQARTLIGYRGDDAWTTGFDDLERRLADAEAALVAARESVATEPVEDVEPLRAAVAEYEAQAEAMRRSASMKNAASRADARIWIFREWRG